MANTYRVTVTYIADGKAESYIDGFNTKAGRACVKRRTRKQQRQQHKRITNAALCSLEEDRLELLAELRVLEEQDEYDREYEEMNRADDLADYDSHYDDGLMDSWWSAMCEDF